MKIILFSRPEIEFAGEEIEAIFASLEENGLEYTVNVEFAHKINSLLERVIPQENQYENFASVSTGDSIMVSYGGDGTFLDAVRMLRGNTPILGINFGHLGFLANVPKQEIKNVFGQLKAGRYTLQERSVLRIEGDFEVDPQQPYAFNEFVVHRDATSMISVEALVNGEKLATYRGDGVMVSTPTGSTAYSLSAGGPIVAPDCKCMIVSPIAPHNLTMRPLVIPEDSQVELRISTREKSAMVSLDNLSLRAGNGAAFRIGKAEKSIFLVNLQNISFYDTLRNKMMWGVDGRDAHK